MDPEVQCEARKEQRNESRQRADKGQAHGGEGRGGACDQAQDESGSFHGIADVFPRHAISFYDIGVLPLW